MTLTTDLSDVLFYDLKGASDGKISGDSIGGVGENETDVGASTMGEGLGETTRVGEKNDAGSGAGGGDGDFPNDSVRRSKLSTMKRQGGVALSTISATLDESTPIFRTTEPLAMGTIRSHFVAPLVASVPIGPLLIKTILKLGRKGLDNIILHGNALRTTFCMTP
ncbi:hypothetical protein PVL29_022184 [Vitis rotundifolia]|uniref:Uncharacterized protein n=1 Tax=Vitis rotundifolia TaxID=103349 RepID=A0AA38YUR4_VITRO|nr:hypothetical protein PVL29_022184 [Vitis rotundifolia]